MQKLLSFYESEYDPESAGGEAALARRWWPLDTHQTAAASKEFRKAPIPDEKLVAKFVDAWRSTKFLV